MEPPTMAETFRSQLLRAENVVQPNSSERCYICLTEWGTLCNDTGTVEMEIQLPCKHTVGSGCIAKWLDPTGAASNSCPVCRYEFFPAQPRPYLEHGIIDEDYVDMTDNGEYDIDGRPRLENPYLSPGRMENNDEEEDEEERDHADRTNNGEHDNSAGSDLWARSPVDNALSEFNLPIEELSLIGGYCQHYCFWLEMPSSLRVNRLSQCLSRAIYVADLFEGHNLSVIAAVSVFVASYLEEVPRTLGWMSTISRLDSDVIASLYGVFRLTAEQSGVVSRRLLRIIGKGDWDAVLRFLPDVGSLLA